jgi:hypothetical protein
MDGIEGYFYLIEPTVEAQISFMGMCRLAGRYNLAGKEIDSLKL